MESLIQSGSAELCRVINQDFSCMLTSREVCSEDLVRNAIVNASLPQLSMEEEVSWWGEPIQLLVRVSCFTVKSQLMLWNTEIQYCRKACFPRLNSCFLKRNDQMLLFNKTKLLPTLQRPPGPIRVQIWTLYTIKNIWSHIKHKLPGKHFSTICNHQHWMEQRLLFFL